LGVRVGVWLQGVSRWIYRPYAPYGSHGSGDYMASDADYNFTKLRCMEGKTMINNPIATLQTIKITPPSSPQHPLPPPALQDVFAVMKQLYDALERVPAIFYETDDNYHDLEIVRGDTYAALAAAAPLKPFWEV